MRWFKFYAQDFLTDPKMRMLSAERKMCWVILMCLANAEDKNGLISFVTEKEVMRYAGIEEDTPSWFSTRGFLQQFRDLKMLEYGSDRVTSALQRNAGVDSGVDSEPQINLILTNFNRRQNENLTGAERQKRHRERLKTMDLLLSNDSNADEGNGSDARLEETRLDKNIYNLKVNFETFWSSYPKKLAKQDALRAFMKISPDSQMMDRMLAAIETQKKSYSWTKSAGQFIPYPATWLNNRRWDDEIKVERVSQPIKIT